MLSESHRRCWIAAAPGAAQGHHHRTEAAAARACVDRLMAAMEQVIRGLRRRESIPIEELSQLHQRCWTMSCDGCRRQLVVDGQRHWAGPQQASRFAAASGWDEELELCGECVRLVVPLKSLIDRRQVAGSAAG